MIQATQYLNLSILWKTNLFGRSTHSILKKSTRFLRNTRRILIRNVLLVKCSKMIWTLNVLVITSFLRRLACYTHLNVTVYLNITVYISSILIRQCEVFIIDSANGGVNSTLNKQTGHVFRTAASCICIT